MRFAAARYCPEPQAFDRRVDTRQAVRFRVNEALIALFQGLVTELHDEEFSKLGEVHFQEVSLLQLLEFGTDGKKSKRGQPCSAAAALLDRLPC